MNTVLQWAGGRFGVDQVALVFVAGKVTVLLAVAWAAHAALSGCNPRWRVGLWRAMTVGLVLICALAMVRPLFVWRLERSRVASEVSQVDAGSNAVPIAVGGQREFGGDSALAPAMLDVEWTVRPERGSGEARVDVWRREVGATPAAAGQANAGEKVVQSAAGFGAWLLVVWMAGVVILAGRLGASAWRLSRVIRCSKDAPDWVIDECRAVAGSLGVVRDVRVLRSVDVLTPCLAGLRRPVILLPDRQCRDGERPDLRAILAHELWHARTHDLAWNAAMHVTSLLLWFHPLIWRARAAHAAACDLVCDSVAADLIGDVSSYCGTLARLALAVSGRPAHGLAMARTSEVSRRIESLHRKVFRALPLRAVLSVQTYVGVLVVFIGGLGFIRADEPTSSKAQEAGASTPGAAAGPLPALARAQIDPYELSVAGAGDPALTLPNLVAILGDSRLQMQWSVQALAFTPDGRSLIGAGDPVIRLWDPVTGSEQRLLRGHTDLVSALALSADGKTLVTGSFDFTLKVWDLAAGKERITIKDDRGTVSCVAVSSDGMRIASGDHSSKIRLWDGPNFRRQLSFLEGHGQSVNALAFSPDAKALASAGDDGTIRLWDISSGRTVKTLDRAPERWRALAFSPDGKTLAAGGYDHGLVLWDTITWTVRLHVPEVDGLGVSSLAFTRDGRRLALVLGYAARIIDAQTGELLRQFPKQSIGINALALGRDDATLATSGAMVTLWDIASGQETTPELAGHRGSVDSLAFSSDGAQLATASLDGTIKLWNLADRKERLALRGYDSCARAVAFRPDGKALASLGFGPDLILWELPSGKKLQTFKGEGDVSKSVFFSPDGRWVAAAAINRIRDGSLSLWDLETGQLHSTLSAGDGMYSFSPDSKKIIFAGNAGGSRGDRRIVVWDIAGKKIEQTTEASDLPFLGVGELSPDGRVFALAGMSDGRGGQRKAVVSLWGLAERRAIYQLDFGDAGGATHLAFARDGRTLLGVRRDGVGQVWDPRNGTLRETIQIAEAGRDSVIRDVAFAPDGRHFAAAMGNGTARIFRIKTAPVEVEPRAPVAVARAKAENAGELWKRLVGKPAPELREIQAWDGGTPVTMADLRGRFVLLQFWNEQSPYQLGSLIGVHEQFADQGKGLVIIVLVRGVRNSAADFEGWKGLLADAPVGNRAVPFRVALDGGGVTAIVGTDAVAYGATHAAFGVHSGYDWRWPAVNVLIGPDGKVLDAGPGVGKIGSKLETAMGVKAKVPAWRQRFEELYELRPGQVLKRVAPPYPVERSDYSFYISARPSGDSSGSYVFYSDGHLREYGMHHGNRLRDDVLVFALGFRKAEIEGPRELLEMEVKGDWIIRPGTSKADLLKAVEAILRDELKQPVRFTEREVERDVLVVKGRYRFHPLGDVPGETVVHLGTDALPPRDGGGGSGSLQKMFEWLGNRTGFAVVDESEPAAGVGRLVWRDHMAQRTTGGAVLDRVLENLTKQTELTFQRARRPVKVWVVSRGE